MIEQTDLILTEWHYHAPANSHDAEEKFSSFISFDVMKKRAATKKGIACRFSSRFVLKNETILEYVAEDSYVIDLEDVIDKAELQTIITNSYTKYKEKFDHKKMETVLQNKSLMPLDEAQIDYDAILLLLK
jgi:hypothetical protein